LRQLAWLLHRRSLEAAAVTEVEGVFMAEAADFTEAASMEAASMGVVFVAADFAAAPWDSDFLDWTHMLIPSVMVVTMMMTQAVIGCGSGSTPDMVGARAKSWFAIDDLCQVRIFRI
jgi:hypothetical protein